MVFDITSRESFEGLDAWYTKIIDGCESKVVVTLIGNKYDLPNRAVTNEEVMAFAKERNMNFMEVSAKSGYNISNAFQLVVEEVYRQ